ncbi:MAG TPA: hypothetical protein VI504_00205 [Candidatus Eisenbacteria bacterium]|jgi:hypothetical protein
MRPVITDEQVQKASQLLRDGYSLAATARHLDLDTAGYHALKLRLRKNLAAEFVTVMHRKKSHREVGAE